MQRDLFILREAQILIERWRIHYNTAMWPAAGFGYASEYHAERDLRESLVPCIVPVQPQRALSIIAQRVLGPPKYH